MTQKENKMTADKLINLGGIASDQALDEPDDGVSATLTMAATIALAGAAVVQALDRIEEKL